VVPSGSVAPDSSPADAEVSPNPATLTVQAVDSTASGKSAVAFCMRPKRCAGIV
jgi:hypothetical protein